MKDNVQDMQNTAFIRDNALVLHFDTSETPFVARFDLDSLVQANFEVVSRNGAFVLTLRDFSGEQQVVGQFGNKGEAHQALYAILQALLAHPVSGCKKDIRQSSGRGWRFLKKALLFVVAMAVLGFIILFFMAQPLLPSRSSNGSASKAPGVMEKMSTTSPEGEPVDMDSLLSQTSPQG